MTRAVCILCGSEKFGAWTQCPNCRFAPKTSLELIVGLSYSDQGRYRDRLAQVSHFVRQQRTVAETGQGDMPFDVSMIEEVMYGIKNPDFRDIITLRRAAKDTLFSKQLNLHEIGPDGYHGRVLKRGRDIDAAAFDAIRSVDDGALYVVISYEDGQQRQAAVSKGKWYAVYDLMLLAEREAQSRPKLQMIYEALCKRWVEKYLTEA